MMRKGSRSVMMPHRKKTPIVFQDCFSYIGYIKKLAPIRNGWSALLHKHDATTARVLGGNKKPIFVTGIHRSGTSWIGDIMSKATDIVYWREPFNPSVVKCMRQQYLYLQEQNDDEFYKQFMENLLEEKYIGSLFDFTTPANWFASNVHRPLIKDPTAAFMLGWIARHYDISVVAVVRHPAGFISSILKLNWDLDFDWFLMQEKLMQDYLRPFERVITEHNYRGMDVKKGAVLWGVVYYVLEKSLASKDVIWITYEDLCSEPVKNFRRLFSQLHVDWSSKIERRLKKSTSSDLTFGSDITTKLQRDTEKMVEIWKERLHPDDIKAIDQIVREFQLESYDKYVL